MLTPIAHAGHVLVDLLIYGSPVAIALIALKVADRIARDEDEDGDGEEAEGEEAAA